MVGIEPTDHLVISTEHDMGRSSITGWGDVEGIHTRSHMHFKQYRECFYATYSTAKGFLKQVSLVQGARCCAPQRKIQKRRRCGYNYQR